MRKQLVKWDKVVTKDGKPEDTVLIREQGSGKVRSVWDGNLKKKEG